MIRMARSRIRLPRPTKLYRPRNDQHVEPYGDRWCVRAEGEIDPSYVCPGRHEAFVWAAEVAKRHQARVVVHRTDGSVQRELAFDTSA